MPFKTPQKGALKNSTAVAAHFDLEITRTKITEIIAALKGMITNNKNKIEVDPRLEDSREILETFEKPSLPVSNDVAFGLDIKMFLDKAFKGCITDALKDKGSVSTEVSECNSVRPSALEGVDQGFFEIQYLSRKIGVWRAMLLSSQPDINYLSFPRSSSSSSSLPSSILPPPTSPLSSPSLSHRKTSPSHSLSSHSPSISTPSKNKNLTVKTHTDSVYVPTVLTPPSSSSSLSISNPLECLGLSGIRVQATSVLYLLRTCHDLCDTNNLKIIIENKNENNSFENDIIGDEKSILELGKSFLINETDENLVEVFNDALNNWRDVNGFVNTSSPLESSEMINFTMKDLVLNSSFDIDFSSLISNGDFDDSDNNENDEINHNSSNNSINKKIANNNSAQIEYNSVLVEKCSLKHFRNHYKTLFSLEQSAGIQSTIESENADELINNRKRKSGRKKILSISGVKCFSDTDLGNVKTKEIKDNEKLYNIMNIINNSLTNLIALTTSAMTDYDPILCGWRVGVSGGGLTLESRLQTRIDQLKVLVRELSLSWFLEVQDPSDCKSPSMILFQGDSFFFFFIFN